MTRPDVSLVLDVHSFPRDSFGSGYDVVLLDDTRVETGRFLEDNIRFADRIGQVLGHNRVALLAGEGNDIQDEALARGLKATLVEFSEQTDDLSTIELEQCANAIALYSIVKQ